MAVAVERLPLAARRPAVRPRTGVLVCSVAALTAVLGLGIALFFGVAPTRVTAHAAVNVVDATGREGGTLVVSDRTRPLTRTVSCVPLSHYDGSADNDAACWPKTRPRLQVAGFGVVAFVAGIALWAVSGGDRYLGYTAHRTYVAAPRP